MYWLNTGFVLAHLLPSWVPTCIPICEQKHSILSNFWCNSDVTGYIRNNLDAMNWIYTFKIRI